MGLRFPPSQIASGPQNSRGNAGIASRIGVFAILIFFRKLLMWAADF